MNHDMHWLVKPGGCWPQAGAPGFLEFLYAQMYVCTCAYVCVSAPRLLITSDVMWCDIDPYALLNKFYGFYMATVVGIISGHALSIHGDNLQRVTTTIEGKQVKPQQKGILCNEGCGALVKTFFTFRQNFLSIWRWFR